MASKEALSTSVDADTVNATVRTIALPVGSRRRAGLPLVNCPVYLVAEVPIRLLLEST